MLAFKAMILSAALALPVMTEAATISYGTTGGTLSATLVASGKASWSAVKQSKSTVLPKHASWTVAPEVLSADDLSKAGGDPCRNACSPFYGGVFGAPSSDGAPGWETTPFFTIFDPKDTLVVASDPSLTRWDRSAVLGFTKPQNTLSFLWGSPDRENSVELLLGTQLVGIFWGADFDRFDETLVGTPGRGAALLSLTGLTFDSVRFSTWAYKGSFEISNIANEVTPVPLPPGFLVLLSALGLLGAVRRYQTRATPS